MASRNSSTIAFRVRPEQKKLLEAGAARRGELPSDWLREIVDQALTAELRELLADSDSGTKSYIVTPESGGIEAAKALRAANSVDSPAP